VQPKELLGKGGGKNTKYPVTKIKKANRRSKTVERVREKAFGIKVPEGFKRTKEFGYPHGQKVYEYEGKYYTRDADSHNGGVWKVFEKSNGRLKRIGTADKFLNIFKN